MNRRSLLALSLTSTALATCIALAGCDDGDSSSSSTTGATTTTTTTTGAGGGGGGGQGGAGGGGTAITWGACPESYVNAECAMVPMPLDHDHPEAGSIEIFVARRLSGQPDAPQLWMLQGGPGSSGESFFLSMVDLFAELMPGVDIYVPDHRGTGRSAYLGCAGEDPGSPGGNLIVPEEWPACAAQVAAERGPELPFLNVTSAARDLGALIDRTRAPAQPFFIYGLSYGTYLAERYLHLFPEEPAGVILEGVVSPGELFVSGLDANYDPVAQQYAALCAADATCSARLGPDPWAHLGAIAASLDAGHCAQAGIDRPLLRRIMAESFTAFRGRLVSLALPYRLERCSAEDIVAIEQFKSIWLEPYDLLGFSQALEVHIDFSEIWESPPPSPAELHARADGAIYSLNWAAERAEVFAAWPKYPADPYTLAWPATSVPMLMLNGTLDPQTTLDTAQVAAAHFNGPHQTFVALPNVPHVPSTQSPTTLGDGIPCGARILASFVTDPEAPPDTSCIPAIRPVVFEDAGLASVFFNTGSMWDNTPAATAGPPPPAARGPWRRPEDLR